MLPLLLKYVGVRESVIGVLLVGLFWVGNMWHGASVELQKAKIVYEHPQIKTVEKIVYKQGPVRIKTVVVKEKDGSEITTTEEDRAAVTTETNNLNESAPVALSKTLAPARTDRYLLSIGANRLSADVDGKAIFAGYGWKNRFDLQVGGVQHNGFSPWVLATLRF